MPKTYAVNHKAYVAADHITHPKLSGKLLILRTKDGDICAIAFGDWKNKIEEVGIKPDAVEDTGNPVFIGGPEDSTLSDIARKLVGFLGMRASKLKR